MSHPEQMQFFSLVIRYFERQFSGDVIDIGSMDINGGPHHLISPNRYVGVDLAEGPNVTLVSHGQDVAFDQSSFDVAMSSECFEHNPNWKETLKNMIRMTKPGGVIAFSCATKGRAEHGTTRSDQGYAAPAAVSIGQEYYKNVTKMEVWRVIRRQPLARYYIYTNYVTHDLYFVALKKKCSTDDLQNIKKLNDEYKKDLEPLASKKASRELKKKKNQQNQNLELGE